MCYIESKEICEAKSHVDVFYIVNVLDHVIPLPHVVDKGECFQRLYTLLLKLLLLSQKGFRKHLYPCYRTKFVDNISNKTWIHNILSS